MADVLVRVEFGKSQSPECRHLPGLRPSDRVVCFACYQEARFGEGGSGEPGASDASHLPEPRAPLTRHELDHRRRMLAWLRQA